MVGFTKSYKNWAKEGALWKNTQDQVKYKLSILEIFESWLQKYFIIVTWLEVFITKTTELWRTLVILNHKWPQTLCFNVQIFKTIELI